MTDITAPISFASRGAFQQALRDAFAQAAADPLTAREIILCDPDFTDWPLGEPALIESLSHWASAHHRLLLLAHSFDEVARQHARWVTWRRQWSHIVECRATDGLERAEVPSVWFAPRLLAVRRWDLVHHTGHVYREPGELVRVGEDLDAVTQRSVTAFPATTLGL